MAELDPENLTKLFIKKKFGEYYKKAEFSVRKLEEREFAFVPVDTLPEFVMHRHIAFKTPEELREYVLSNIPAHIYYSSAYYEKPDANRMEEKIWKAADLIFDIDADHIPVKNLSFERALKRAKVEVKKLVLILRRDFGIDEDEMRVYFSGGRGYHVHVNAEEFVTLGSAERREIIDYLLITNPRILNAGYLSNSNVASRILSALKRKFGVKASTNQKLRRDVLKLIKSHSPEIIERLRVYIDAPVTADIKRLIRMPNSLHGKTGLRVTEVDELESFDPLTDAVVFGDEKVSIKVVKDLKIKLGGENFRLKAGEVAKVPEFLAVFGMCRGAAHYRI